MPDVYCWLQIVVTSDDWGPDDQAFALRHLRAPLVASIPRPELSFEGIRQVGTWVRELHIVQMRPRAVPCAALDYWA